ncbi:MAG: hypothetical protein ACJA2B_001729 [Candidatus Endobugula sp.]|jgi:hypothetical protein
MRFNKQAIIRLYANAELLAFQAESAFFAL